MFKIDVLASSSAGNCYVISKGDRHFMIECGIPFREISKKMLKLGLNFNQIDFCLVSHHHQDHAASVKDIKRSGIMVIGPENVAASRVAKDSEYINLHPYSILPFKVIHGECNCLGYLIKFEDECLMFATDCRLIEMNLKPANIKQMMIECNYLDSKLNIESLREKRQLNTHMGLKGCITHIEKFKTDSLKEIYLLHMSAKYGDTIACQSLVEVTTGIKTYVALEKGGIC